MALDQGTTSSRCILFDKSGAMISIAQKEYTQNYPKQGIIPKTHSHHDILTCTIIHLVI